MLRTELLAAPRVPAPDLLALDLARGSRERGFPQIPAGFHLPTLMGRTPQGTGLQVAVWGLLSNMGQVGRTSGATAQARPGPTLATALLCAAGPRQRVAVTERVPVEGRDLSFRGRVFKLQGASRDFLSVC
jgi:hypothetical protein